MVAAYRVGMPVGGKPSAKFELEKGDRDGAVEPKRGEEDGAVEGEI